MPSIRKPHPVLLAALAALLLPPSLEAQARDSIPGVALGLLYETGAYQPPIVVKPFVGRMGGESIAGQVEAIVARDLRYSDRFKVMDSIPGAFLNQEGIDYALWDRLGVVWLLSGQVEPSGDGYAVSLELHDVVYKQLKERGSFRIPASAAPDFRMAVHRTSDEVVRWAFAEPGMAASRVAFTMLQNGVKELYVVDSDGENLQRLTNLSDVVLSPAWSPDGRRIAYSAPSETGDWQISEYDLTARRTRRVQSTPNVDFFTPAYHPDGETFAFSMIDKNVSNQFIDVATYNISRECCRRSLTQRARDNLSPTFSPDGRYLAFNSNRLGDAVPQIFVMPSDGGSPELISPYGFDRQGYYTSPDWSPFGDLVAFHGRVSRSGPFHILVARMGERARLTQLTWEGNNEDPSWAPDGRHLVFRGERRWGKGLFVVDTVTGTVRAILSGVEVSTPQWSPALGEPGARPE
jgi:TolB protein